MPGFFLRSAHRKPPDERRRSCGRQSRDAGCDRNAVERTALARDLARINVAEKAKVRGRATGGPSWLLWRVSENHEASACQSSWRRQTAETARVRKPPPARAPAKPT